MVGWTGAVTCRRGRAEAGGGGAAWRRPQRWPPPWRAPSMTASAKPSPPASTPAAAWCLCRAPPVGPPPDPQYHRHPDRTCLHETRPLCDPMIWGREGEGFPQRWLKLPGDSILFLRAESAHMMQQSTASPLSSRCCLMHDPWKALDSCSEYGNCFLLLPATDTEGHGVAEVAKLMAHRAIR